MTKIPRYQKLLSLLTEKVTSGAYKPGDRFFSQTELMKKYSLSFATVTRALNELEREGFVVREQGRGTFVRSTQKNAAPAATDILNVNVFIPWDSRVPSHVNYRTLFRGLDNNKPSFIQLQLIPYSMNPDDLEPFLLKNENVAGFIFVYPEKVHLPLVKKLARQQPTVVIGTDLRTSNIGCVWTDNKMAAEQAVMHLIDQGHKHIGIVSAPLTITDAAERLAGYRSALKQSRLQHDKSWEIFTHPVELNGYGACIELLERHPDLTAIFAAGDVLAMGVLAAAKADGRQIPDELSVVGFDDTDFAADLNPPLTTIHVSYEDLAKKAIEALVSLMQTGTATKTCLPAHLVVRSSTSKMRIPAKL
jgi:DNA-binding LacI/PurR family transcriptional regulator/DNA-binding MarR family transcriptional regulator